MSDFLDNDRIHCDDIVIQPLSLSDAEQLTEIYRSVEITKNNYKQRFSDSEFSFKNHGGMFIINDLETNKRILSSENDVVLGGKSNGELRGMIWYNLSECEFPFDDIAYFDQYAEYKDILAAERQRNKILVGKEIIVLPDTKGHLAYRFFEILFNAAKNAGMEYKTGEVYRVNGYKDEDGYHSCDMLNIPSYKTLLHTGGIPIGTLPQKIISKDGIDFYITPQVILWNVNDAIIKMQNQ